MERNNNEDNEEYDPLALRVRGLPWSATKDDIVKFFEGCNIKDGPAGIHLTVSREGRPSGEAYVEFETEEDTEKGLAKNNEHLGSRYIEVFRSKKNEMEWALQRWCLEDDANSESCVRLRGLPFGCSKEEIAQFFTGLEIVRNGITLPTDFQGRSTGEAYVQFASREIAEKAMGKHKEKIGHRYIEIFKSSMQEIRSAMGMGPVRAGRPGAGANRMTPYERPGQGRGARGRGRGGPMGNFGDRGGPGFGPGERIRDTGHNIHMRGLPFRAVERDIFEFFAPIKPIAVRIKFEASGRASGEADAMFATHEDAARSMKKDKEKMQHRYIELFLESEPDRFGPGGGIGYPIGPYGRGRGFMGGDSDGFGMGPDRGFGGPGAERGGFGSRGRGFGTQRGGFSGGYGESGSAGSSRGGFMGGASSSMDQGFGFGDTKPFSSGEGFGANSRGGFSGSSGDRSFGGAGGMSSGYGSTSGADRANSTPFTTGYAGGAANRSFGNATDRYGGGADSSSGFKCASNAKQQIAQSK